jgi:hypothetical protein
MIPGEDIDRRFNYHAPDSEKVSSHEQVRGMSKTLARNLNVLLPDGREKSLAITHLEEVMMWSNAAIAREGN